MKLKNKKLKALIAILILFAMLSVTCFAENESQIDTVEENQISEGEEANNTSTNDTTTDDNTEVDTNTYEVGETESNTTSSTDTSTSAIVEAVVYTLNKSSDTIIVGKTTTLKLTNADSSKITWSTSNKKIATVSNGVVTGVKAGTATITAKYEGTSYTCKVKVESPSLNHTTWTLVKGFTYTLKFNNTTLSATWSSSNTKVATVNSSGKITPKAKGTATITGTISGKKYTCKIKVDSVSLNATSKTIVKGKTYTLKLSGSSRKVTYKSYNTSIAKVSSKGVITAKKAGTVKIAAITGGKEFICTVKVVNKGLNKSSLTMTKGNTYTLKTYGVSGKKVWSSSNKKVATVSSKGVITAKGKGSATITLKVGGKKYTCKVKVEAPYITVSKTTIVVGSESTFKMYGTSKSYSWSSSNKSVATVSSKGLVTGVKAGTATITGTVDSRKYSYKVTVKNASSYSGWIEKSGKEYYNASGVLATGLKTIDGKRYVFDENGVKISYFGIDVSKFQGTIDWEKAKDDGVEYAFLRLGFRGYGSSGTLNLDSKFVENATNATKNGIPIGVYFFTQATNAKEGKAEAEFVLETISENNIDVTWPIVIDTELSGAVGNTGRADSISKAKRTEAIKAFCETIENAGYTPMIYASKSWLTNKLDMTQLSDYEVWLAHYISSDTYSSYTGSYSVWQYSSSGSISGISGKVDMDVAFKKY